MKYSLRHNFRRAWSRLDLQTSPLVASALGRLYVLCLRFSLQKGSVAGLQKNNEGVALSSCMFSVQHELNFSLKSRFITQDSKNSPYYVLLLDEASRWAGGLNLCRNELCIQLQALICLQGICDWTGRQHGENIWWGLKLVFIAVLSVSKSSGTLLAYALQLNIQISTSLHSSSHLLSSVLFLWLRPHPLTPGDFNFALLLCK